MELTMDVLRIHQESTMRIMITVNGHILLWHPYVPLKLKSSTSYPLILNRFRCPKGWKRLGGSCYYLSNLTSISSAANHTCNYLHSNLS
ncbi:unnamed protein product, partial [Rotaria sordida]